ATTGLGGGDAVAREPVDARGVVGALEHAVAIASVVRRALGRLGRWREEPRRLGIGRGGGGQAEIEAVEVVGADAEITVELEPLHAAQPCRLGRDDLDRPQRFLVFRRFLGGAFLLFLFLSRGGRR